MTTLKDYILHQLREARREMLKAIDGLSPEVMASHAPGGHSPIAWIVCHCLVNVDFFIHSGITGEFGLEHDDRFRRWPLIEPAPGDAFPPPAELTDRWSRLLDASCAAVESLPDDALQQPGKSANPPEPLVESCLRVINHTNAHLRQIWCILGRQRVDDRYPTQETWLA